MTTTTQPSPFFITDDQATASPYWEARHELADAMRKLNALVVTSDLSESDCQDITREVAALSHRLSARDQYPGIVAWSKAKKFGDMPRINYEVLSIGGRSHPGAPGMKMSGHHGQRAKPAMPILRQHRATPRREPRNSRDMD